MRERENVYKGRTYNRSEYGKRKGGKKKRGMIEKTLKVQAVLCVGILGLSVCIKNSDLPVAVEMRQSIAKSLNVSTNIEDVAVFFGELEEVKDRAVAVFAPKEQKVEEVKTAVLESEKEGVTDDVIKEPVMEDSINQGSTAQVNSLEETPLAVIPISFNEVMFYVDYDTGEVRSDQPMTTVKTGNDVLSNLISPITGTITSSYGGRIHPITKKETFHYGADVAPMEEAAYKIMGAYDGVVEKAGENAQSGNYILLGHEGGIKTFYAHCKELYVAVGDRVKQGDVIGYVGSTGMSTGNHLHFEVRNGSEVYNPLDYVKFRSEA